MKRITISSMLFLAVLFIPAKAQAQDSHSLNSNEHAPTINNGMKPALPAGSTASAPASKSSEVSGTNDEYVESKFVEYKDALKQGQQQKVEQAKPKTIADIARENREAKAKAAAAQPKAKAKLGN